MASFRWRLHGEEGTLLADTEQRPSREDAEAWLADNWASLAAAGAASVSLMEGEQVVYEMSLEAP